MQDTIQSRRKSEKILWLTLSDLIDVRAFFHPSKMVPPPPLSDEQAKPASLKSEWSPSPSTSSSSSSPIFTSSGQISEEEVNDVVYASTSAASSSSMTNTHVHSTLAHRQNHFLRLPPRQLSSFRTNRNSDNSDDSEVELEDDEEDEEDEVEQSGSSGEDEYEDEILPIDYLAQALPTLSYVGTHSWSPSYSTREEASSPEIEICTPPTQDVKIRNITQITETLSSWEISWQGAEIIDDIDNVEDDDQEDQICLSPLDDVCEGLSFSIPSSHHRLHRCPSRRTKSASTYIVVNDNTDEKKLLHKLLPAVEDMSSEIAPKLPSTLLTKKQVTLPPRLVKNDWYDGGMESVDAFNMSSAAFRDYCSFKPEVLISKLELLMIQQEK